MFMIYFYGINTTTFTHKLSVPRHLSVWALHKTTLFFSMRGGVPQGFVHFFHAGGSPQGFVRFFQLLPLKPWGCCKINRFKSNQ